MGTTQLTVSGIHGQPNLSGSNRTCLSVVRNFHFQSQCDSHPRDCNNHRIPRSVAVPPAPVWLRAYTAKPVKPDPSGSSPRNAGQLPFGFWIWSRKRMVQSLSRSQVHGSARRARAVGSTAAWAQLELNAQPPCGSCREMSCSIHRRLADCALFMRRVVGDACGIVKFPGADRIQWPAGLVRKCGIGKKSFAFSNIFPKEGSG